MNFDQAFHQLLGHEGGYVDHPADPGGATCWGVTERVARANGYTGPMKSLPVDVAKAIYKRDYWDAVRADEVPDAIRYSLFDGAVNSGVKQSVKWLQRALGVTDDGVLGPQTLQAANAADGPTLKAKMLGARLQFMADLPTWPAFGKGWSRRIASLMVTT
ncbi:lysozyme family protein [Acidovorax delafieldii]|uniref:Lysozyme family protein n=1 Tax=Acidovorax delafieldii TaxID=47920 RepID=A0AAJ2BVP0_ACIDE|nr:glycosyl hydrolase 108 family protein [Acidovorax delafieldii]MDR6768606.1 lysozyme family protein [Acidovorax delafieldii]MDR6837321.1 lysozyme family protein [Acidovorax delafieldii]MDR7366812.1 lysozyme family protein [Acidovorax delafieldii]